MTVFILAAVPLAIPLAASKYVEYRDNKRLAVIITHEQKYHHKQKFLNHFWVLKSFFNANSFVFNVLF